MREVFAGRRSLGALTADFAGGLRTPGSRKG
jgi:hypothetical protein